MRGNKRAFAIRETSLGATYQRAKANHLASFSVL